jgi:polar amino acid transport system substrate-binding protein
MTMASQLAPTGALRVGVWTVPYFAHRQDSGMSGIIPDLGGELARRVGVKPELAAFDNPARMLAAFREGALDVTFLGITADRAEVIDFGPVMFELQTTYLVPASSAIVATADIDQVDVRIAVPSRSAQEAHLRQVIRAATLMPIPAENPQYAVELIEAGQADAFSHVAPMLAAVQAKLPGSRILAGSYFNVPVAIGVAKGRPPAVAEAVRTFAEDVKRGGFLQLAIDRAGVVGVMVAR